MGKRSEQAKADGLEAMGFLPYTRLNGAPIVARLNRGPAYSVHGVTCHQGEYEVRDGEFGTGWIHTVSPAVFREFYV